VIILRISVLNNQFSLQSLWNMEERLDGLIPMRSRNSIYLSPGIFLWLVRSSETVSHCTFVPHLCVTTFKNMLQTHLFSRSYFTD